MSEPQKRYIEVSNLPHLEVSCSDGKKYVLLPVDHLSDIPSADVEECRYGYWEKDPIINRMWCSNCYSPPPGDAELEDFYESDFCPSCGSYMCYFEQVEICPYCDKENVFPMWLTEKQGFIATCQHCGEEILLCDACQHTVCEDGEPHNCDWQETDCGGKCHRGETTRKGRK